MIFYLLSRSEWEKGTAYVAAPGDAGFVHCCDERQIDGVRRSYFPPGDDVVAIAFDPTQLAAETRYEPGTGGEPERFPHVYGTLPRDSVVLLRQVPSNAG